MLTDDKITDFFAMVDESCKVFNAVPHGSFI